MDPGFVGRSVELTELLSRLDDALAGRSAAALVAGEPGIGKTRLVTELTRLAGARAVPTLWGGCTEEEGAPAYWPWRRILRSWLALAGREAAARLGDGDAAELARIAPEFGRGEGTAGHPAAGPEQRFALFETVAGFLAGIAANGGLLVVLDDVHWADAASLHLLAHVARETPNARLMLVATYRPAELAADPARAALVTDLVRLPGGVHLDLAGLDEPEVAVTLAERLGTEPSPDLVAAVARRTGGNPFFVGELGRLLQADPDAGPLRVPAAVRDVVARRLTRLPAACRAVLEPAAVIGTEVEVGLVAAVAGIAPDTALDDLRPALDDGVLVRPPGRTGLRFGHDLVRETLLAELAPAQRARTHLAVATVLAPRAADPDVLSELAHHALAAMPLGDAAAALGWARRASELALTQLAYEEAARLLALAGSVGQGTLDPAERVDLALARAHAQALAHDVPGAIASCTEAADLARRTGDAAALGRAALGMPTVSEVPWLTMVRGWCEDALRDLGEGDSPLRAQLLAQLAHSLVLAADRPGMAAASQEALAMAERLDDPPSLASALRARQLACSDADGNAERLVLGGRMLATSARSGHAADAMWGHLWRFDALLQAGRVVDAEAELDRLEPIVATLRQPVARLQLLRGRVALALGRGRFTDAARMNEKTVLLAERGGHRGAFATACSVRFAIAAVTGGGPGDLSWFLDAPELEAPFTAVSRGSFAVFLLAAGRKDEAEQWYAGLPEPGSPRIPPFMALPLEAMRAQLAEGLGDASTAEVCHRLLLPHADLHAVGGAGAITTGGSAQLYLGVAALGAGRPDAAVRHLRAAVTVNDAAGLAPFTAMARYRLAVALRARGKAADVDDAVALAAAAGASAARFGMAALRVQAAALAQEVRDGGVLSRRETEIAELVGRGLTNRQIAATAHISERTVETHVQHVLAKLGFGGRSQIAAWVARRGQ